MREQDGFTSHTWTVPPLTIVIVFVAAIVGGCLFSSTIFAH